MSPSHSSPQKKTQFRWVICGLLFFSVALNYIDRNIIGILKMDLSKELGWTELDYAHIVSAFQIAYAFGYLFGGRLMDWLGIKKGLPLAVLLWSFAAASHGLVSFVSKDAVFSLEALRPISAAMAVSLPFTVVGFIAARMALGLTEGANFPGAIKAVADWFPIKERALATGIFNAGTNVGAIICPIAVPMIYQSLGWAATFYITGSLGIFWLIAWWFLYDNPETHKSVNQAELTYILEGRPKVEQKKVSIPWISLLSYRAVWAYLIAGILAGPVWGIYMFFLPDFLSKRFNLPTQEIGNWTAVFYFVASFGGVAGGWLASRLIGTGMTINAARKISLSVCAVCVLPIFIAPSLNSVWLTVVIVGIAGSAHQGWSANLFSFVSDTMPRQAISSVVGFGGFVSYLTGAVVAELIGQVLKRTGSYSVVFASSASMYVLSLLALHLLVPKIQKETKV